MSRSTSLPSFDISKLAISKVMVLAKAAPRLKKNPADLVRVGENRTLAIYGMKASVIIKLPLASSGIYVKGAEAHTANLLALTTRVQRLEVGADVALTCGDESREHWCPGARTVHLRSSRGVKSMSFYLSFEALLQCSAINLARIFPNTAFRWSKPPRLTLGAAQK
jgi:hypothetical protein